MFGLGTGVSMRVVEEIIVADTCHLVQGEPSLSISLRFVPAQSLVVYASRTELIQGRLENSEIRCSAEFRRFLDSERGAYALFLPLNGSLAFWPLLIVLILPRNL